MNTSYNWIRHTPRLDSVADSPGEDTVEVNLFGPGYGESVVVHLGSDHWLIVDSCARSSGEDPAALAYLQRIGVDVQNQVNYIVVTHWHDDHIRGISELVTECVSADVFLSSALNFKPLMRLVRSDAPWAITNLREMQRTISTLLARSRGNRQAYSFLLENTIIQAASYHPELDVQILALSPSQDDFLAALSSMRYFVEGDSQYREAATVPDPRENHSSVVLYIKTGQQRILLGGDREIHGNAQRGWQSVGTCAARAGLQPASILKVAHHGSPNGDPDLLWDELLEHDAIALVAPYRRGLEGGRPRAEDVTRLCRRTRWAFTTSAPGLTGLEYSMLAEGITEAEAVTDDVEVEPAQLPFGHLRARAPLHGGPWTVELVKPAAHLCTNGCVECLR